MINALVAEIADFRPINRVNLIFYVCFTYDRRVKQLEKTSLVGVGWKKEIFAYVCLLWVYVRGGETTTTSTTTVIAIATTKTWSRMSAFLAHYGAFLCPKCRQVQPGSGISTNDRCVPQIFYFHCSNLSSLLRLSVSLLLLLIVQMPPIQHPMTIDMYSFIFTCMHMYVLY